MKIIRTDALLERNKLNLVEGWEGSLFTEKSIILLCTVKIRSAIRSLVKLFRNELKKIFLRSSKCIFSLRHVERDPICYYSLWKPMKQWWENNLMILDRFYSVTMHLFRFRANKWLKSERQRHGISNIFAVVKQEFSFMISFRGWMRSATV